MASHSFLKEAERFFKVMQERHNIYLRRKSGQPKPWTADKIFRNFRFCNVYRELDTVTVWIRENIRMPYDDHPNLWFMLAIARQINWPPTLRELMDNGCWPAQSPLAGVWNPKHATSIMRARRNRGEQVYTGAYILNGAGVPKGEDKPYFTAHIVLDKVWQDRKILEPQPGDTLETAWGRFLDYHGWGPFMSYEVVTDMRWTRYLNKAADIYTWANPGPGANRGLSRLHGRSMRGRKVLETVRRSQQIQEMRELLKLGWDGMWPKPSKDWPKLEMRDIEHMLCEADKYYRVLNGEGEPRAHYDGGGDT